MRIFDTAESARAFVAGIAIHGQSFELALANQLTFAGSIDLAAAGMAVVVDAILAQGYEPDGFEQHEGFRLYRYKPMEE